MRKFKEIKKELDGLRRQIILDPNNIETYKNFINVSNEMSVLLDRDSLRERRSIEDSRQFARSAEKTQVMMPQIGLDEIIKNRATHSYETSTSSLVIAAYVAEIENLTLNDIDYMRSIHNAALAHDIGHPSFGHDAATLISDYFKAKGLAEGFDDNNNNLIVIEKNNIEIRDYTLASLIKYPNALYPSQVEKYGKILNDALEQDKEHFKQFGFDLSGQKKTIACQIMDEADRNSYTCSDLTDFLSIGNHLEPDDVRRFAEMYNVSHMVNDLIEVAVHGRKGEIRKYFSDLKESFNKNHFLSNNGIQHRDKELLRLRELLSKLSKEFYIKPLRMMDFHDENMKKLKAFINEVVNNKFYPSMHYKDKIENAKNKEERLLALRDMIGEVSDWYVVNMYEKLELGKKKENNSELNI